MRFDRFMWLIGACLLFGCAADSTGEFVEKPSDVLPETTKKGPVPGGVQGIPCSTEVRLTTATGMIVVIYLDCVQEQKKSPRSDDSSWGGVSQGGDITSLPGWTRPEPPGDPRPQ